MTTVTTGTTKAARPSIKLQDERQRDELRRVAGELTARTGQRVTLADVIGAALALVGADGVERLLAVWRAGRTEAG